MILFSVAFDSGCVSGGDLLALVCGRSPATNRHLRIWRRTGRNDYEVRCETDAACLKISGRYPQPTPRLMPFGALQFAIRDHERPSALEWAVQKTRADGIQDFGYGVFVRGLW
jgi:hypothetical protein